MSKIYQITNLQILPSIVNFPNWISDTFCVKPWRKLLPSPAWMPNCRPVLPETDRLKAEPGLMIALFYPPDRTQIRDISSPVPLQWSPHPSRSALKPSFIKLGGLHGPKTPVGAKRVHALATKSSNTLVLHLKSAVRMVFYFSSGLS